MPIAFLASPRVLSRSVGVLGLWLGTPAAAAAPCVSPHIHVELDEHAEWGATIPTLRARLLELRDVDPCAAVTIRGVANGVLVTVTSGDRTASRLVTEPNELVHTVEALVVLPPPLPAAALPAKASPLEVPPPDPRPDHHGSEDPNRVELGLGASVRLGGAPLMVGGGVASFAGLVERDWLLGVNARWEFADGFVSAPPPSGFSMDSGAIGVAVGHRWHAGHFGYDLLVGPNLVLEDVEAFGAPESSNEGIGGSALDARVDVGVRASGPASSPVRFYAAGDFEVSPSRVAHPKEVDPELPPLPAWTSGLALGLVWGVR